MSGSLVLLHVCGAVALLLWATRMVRTGVERAYGPVLRRRLGATLDRPLAAVLCGAVLAMALQSSTAVTLLVASFAGSGLVGGLAGQLAVRGAEVGSALLVKALSLDLELLAPACIAAGTAIFLATERRAWRQAGRILVGIGLLVLSLRLIGEASLPLRESRLMPVMVTYLASDPVTAFLFAALLTWLMHSSIAALLLFATLADAGAAPVELGVALMLGVNLGSSIIAPVLTRALPPGARVVPIGNLLMRGAGSLAALAVLLTVPLPLAHLGAATSEAMVNGHIAFNLLVLVAGVPLAGLVHRASVGIVSLLTPKPPAALLDAAEVSALDEEALAVPAQALANATREVVRICETVELMLQRVIGLFQGGDRDDIQALAALDDRIDRRHSAIKLYLARLTQQPLGDDEAQRCRELVAACVKLEQVGDIVVRNILVQVRKKRERGLAFTDEGWRELEQFHAVVLANARLAFAVLVSRDRDTARRLVMEKDRLRELERSSSDNHFSRLGDGAQRSVETSSIHLDTIRDLKQVNSLLASIAYPLLEGHGMLHDTRLRAI